jgi:hypothetical protein
MTDRRVIAIIPMVFSLLHMEEVLRLNIMIYVLPYNLTSMH